MVRDRSDGILRGYFIFLLDLVARTGRFLIFFFSFGEFSGEGVGILSALSLGRTWNEKNSSVVKLKMVSNFWVAIHFFFHVFLLQTKYNAVLGVVGHTLLLIYYV